MPSPSVIGLPQRPTPRHSALADFLRTHSAEILSAWDEFAATVDHEGQPLDAHGLRDHAAEILQTIALDLAQSQSPAQRGHLVLDSTEETGTTFSAVLPRSAGRGASCHE